MCFSFSFQPLFHTWRAWGGGGGSLWVLAVPVLLHLVSKAERPVHSAMICLDSASSPMPQWELQSLSQVVALLHLSSSRLRSDCQAVVSVPLHPGSKAERPVHSALISPDSASGLTPQWVSHPGSHHGTAPPPLLSPALCLAWLRCLSLFAACQ